MPKHDKKSPVPYDIATREAYLTGLAMDMAEKQLLEGTAPASTVNYFLKLGSEEQRIKQKLLEAQANLAEEKRKNMEWSQKEYDLYQEVIDAFSSYGGGTLC